MLSIGRIADSRAVYFFEEIVLGGDDSYYTQAGEAPGSWIGRGSESLGLSGQVKQEQIANVLAGLAPGGGLKVRETEVARPGFDLTFSAPKSVSLAWALGDADQKEAVAAAHREAVLEAVRYLEGNAASVRRGHAGAQVLPADGFVAATFQHRTNRSLDPQLHTHVVVANMAQGPDERWTALDGRQIFAHSRTSGAIYQARLRYELARGPGFMFLPNPNGTFDVVGISPQQRDQFSKRRTEIKQELKDLGLITAKSAQVATLTTRSAKGPGRSDEQLQQRWSDEAALVDLDVSKLPSMPRIPTPAVPHTDGAMALTASDAAFKRQQVIRTIADHATEGATLDQLESAADAFLASEHAVELGDGWWTTPEELALEQRAVELSSRSIDSRKVSAVDVERTLDVRPTLSHEQQQMIGGILQSKNAVDIVIGWAGTGKTFSLDAVRDAYQSSGYRLTGAALSARAASELEGGSGIPSITADRLLIELSIGRRRLSDKSVVVIDEAGMLGNRRLAAIIEETTAANAKLILVGDPKQLPEIDPGGLFKGLAERFGYFELTDNRRQRDVVERNAVAQLRLGDASGAIDQLVGHGRIVTMPNADRIRDRMISDWMKARAAGESVLMSSSRRAAVEDLNRRARSALRSNGELGETLVVQGDIEFATGDRVMTLRNNQRLGLTNGEVGTIRGLGVEGLQLHLPNGQGRVVPIDYIESGHLAHGYASTIHKAQGATVDRAFVLADDSLSQESGYTALTRGRASNHVYLVTPERPEHQVVGVDPLDLLTHSLGRSAAKSAAIELIPKPPQIGI